MRPIGVWFLLLGPLVWPLCGDYVYKTTRRRRHQKRKN